MRKGLVVVDVQADFCPGGSLAVENGDSVVAPLNRAISAFAENDLPVFFTRDWHPKEHVSFASRGGRWPEHCVQGTAGARFHAGLMIPGTAFVVSKGDKKDAEAYSGFQGTGLERLLRSLDVDEVFIGGLATDYCVKETALDALRLGFKATVIEDCVRPVDALPGDGKKALEEMKRSGVSMVSSSDLVSLLAGAQHYGHHPGHRASPDRPS
jgi:nicotinamidase/pyrazinamidase